MISALLVSILFGFAPTFLFALFIYWLDRYEKEPKALLGGAFFWGVVIAAGGAFIVNTAFGLGIYLFTGSEAATDFGTTSIVAPIVEEFLKGLAVMIVFFIFRREFDSILDGIIYGGIVALGFAATENSFYIYEYGFRQAGWAGLWALTFVRVILVGWQHPFYTAFTGIGFAASRLNRNPAIKFLAPLVGYGVAVAVHSFHNTMATVLPTFLGNWGGLAIGTGVDWFMWACLFVFIMWMIVNEREILKRQLREEVLNGLISTSQYFRALSPWTSSLSRFNGQATARFYRLCGELAHKKEQYKNFGNEGGNHAIIEALRKELASLAPQAK